MLNEIFPQINVSQEPNHQEGELCKVIRLHGKTFEIYYGYYEECERLNPTIDPMPIYPDFLKDPQYTDEGIPFVTMMQNVCEHYQGESNVDKDCSQCRHFRRGDELLGICTCEKNRFK